MKEKIKKEKASVKLWIHLYKYHVNGEVIALSYASKSTADTVLKACEKGRTLLARKVITIEEGEYED